MVLEITYEATIYYASRTCSAD